MQNIPSDLLLIQKWFASVITRPVDENSQMQPLAPSGRLMSEEAKEFILPNARLTSDQRIQIYNQQYWWRLLTTMHQNFPGTLRLFGYTGFNRLIAVPFLSKHFSNHWSLAKLGEQLPKWVEEEYKEADRSLIQSMIELDLAYQELFFAPPPRHLDSSLELLQEKLVLQPHMRLLHFPYHLIIFREDLLKESVEFWEAHPFPSLIKDKEYFMILNRHRNVICHREASQGEWLLLQKIGQGLTIEEACDQLEQEGGEACKEAEKDLPAWIQGWMNERWLSKSKEKL